MINWKSIFRSLAVEVKISRVRFIVILLTVIFFLISIIGYLVHEAEKLDNIKVRFHNETIQLAERVRELELMLGERVHLEDAFSILLEVVSAVAYVESRHNSAMVRLVGEVSAYQLHPVFLSYFERKYWRLDSKFNVDNEVHSMYIAVAYIFDLFSNHSENVYEALKAYNSGLRGRDVYGKGEAYADKILSVLTPEARRYVLRRW